MKSKSSYQKLKKRVAELELDIYQLVRYPDLLPGVMTKQKWEMYFSYIDMAMFGSRDSPPKLKYNTGGILDFIDRQNKNNESITDRPGVIQDKEMVR